MNLNFILIPNIQNTFSLMIPIKSQELGKIYDIIKRGWTRPQRVKGSSYSAY